MDILSGESSDLLDIKDSYESAFPEFERKSIGHLKTLMSSGRYKLLLGQETSTDNRLGYAFVFMTDSQNAWLDYIAIEEDFRGKGYGSKFIENLLDSLPESVKGLFLEVEQPDPSDPKNYEIQKKRVRFYERLGAVDLNQYYMIPTDDGGAYLDLFYIPIRTRQKIKKEEIHNTVADVFEVIHSDVSTSEEIFEEIAERLTDVRLQ